METTLAITPEDLATPEAIANPYPAYRALRGASPVRYVRLPAGRTPGIDRPVWSWALLRFADVSAALRDHGTFSSDFSSTFKALPKLMMLHDDPPRHTQLRRLVNKAFSPRRVAEIEPWIAGVVRSLLDAVADGPADIMRAYAAPLPMKVIATMLGIPPENHATFRLWSEAVIAYNGMPLEERTTRMRDMMAYLGQTAAARRAQGDGDLITALVQAEVDGQSMSDTEVVSFCTLLLLAGNETTTNLIGNMLYLLSERPDVWQKAREDRTLVERILDETLRHMSPVQRLLRITTKPAHVAGVTIPEGEMVDVIYGAANRDPAAFEDPDTFRLDRPAAEHLAFGAGIHSCLGAPLARVEARLALNALLDRFPSITRAAEPAVWQRVAIMALGLQSLPLVLGKEGR